MSDDKPAEHKQASAAVDQRNALFADAELTPRLLGVSAVVASLSLAESCATAALSETDLALQGLNELIRPLGTVGADG